MEAGELPPMLNAFICTHGQPSRISEPSDVAALRNAVWIDLASATEEEIARVVEATGLMVPTEASISEIETSSRLSMRDGVLYLSMPLMTLSDGPRAAAIGFVLTRERLLTVRFAPSRIFDAFAKQMPRGQTGADGGAYIFVSLMEAIVDRQADGLEQVRADLDSISHRIFGMGVNQEGGRKQEDVALREILGGLGRMGDLISHIRETGVGAARIVPYVEAMTKDWLSKELKARLRTLRLDIASVSDFDTHLNDKLQFLLDATLGFINIAQNNVMKVMTITSVAGIPPVLIAGIYGMNFKTMPELEWQWGYAYALILIVLTTLIPLLIFRWRKWI
jgi:magnesium transporter